MPKTSAGFLMYRRREDSINGIEVLLAHPGGPFYAKKNDGVWDILKGEVEGGDDVFQTAMREFQEESGLDPRAMAASDEAFIPLGTITMKSGKTVHSWAFEGNCDPATLTCNMIEIPWPPGTGTMMTIPENDRYAFFPLNEARRKIWPSQIPFLDRLQGMMKTAFEGSLHHS